MTSKESKRALVFPIVILVLSSQSLNSSEIESCVPLDERQSTWFNPCGMMQ